jgi:hypothetical protein
MSDTSFLLWLEIGIGRRLSTGRDRQTQRGDVSAKFVGRLREGRGIDARQRIECFDRQAGYRSKCAAHRSQVVDVAAQHDPVGARSKPLPKEQQRTPQLRGEPAVEWLRLFALAVGMSPLDFPSELHQTIADDRHARRVRCQCDVHRCLTRHGVDTSACHSAECHGRRDHTNDVEAGIPERLEPSLDLGRRCGSQRYAVIRTCAD